MPLDQVFISYSHKDTKWREDLEKHLKPYLRAGSITSWSDKQIGPGSEWFKEIQSASANSKVAVLLVSPDFIASDFIHEQELGLLLKEAEQGGVTILWVPVRQSAYKQTPLKNYQAVLDPGKPLAGMPKAKGDQAWVKICEEIQKAVNKPGEPRPPLHEPAPLQANRSTVLDREAFEGKQDLIVEIAINTSPITSPWRHSRSHRVIRMPRHYVEAEGFSWNQWNPKPGWAATMIITSIYKTYAHLREIWVAWRNLAKLEMVANCGSYSTRQLAYADGIVRCVICRTALKS